MAFNLFFKTNLVAAVPVKFDSVEVTITEGTNMAVDLSPDKETIAMDLQGTIWVVPVQGGKATALTDALGDSRQPVWSPDGSKIAFQSYRDGNYHIWSVDKDGTNLQQITVGVYDEREPYWAPDGRSLIFSSDRSGNYDIWQIDLASNLLNQLTNDPANDYYPAFSADGKQIAFVSERKKAPGVYVLNTEGNEQLLVQSEARLAAPSWSSNGAQIIYNFLSKGESVLQAALLGDGGGQALTAPGEDVFPFRVSWISPEEFIYTADGKIKRRKIGKKEADFIPFQATVTLSRENYARKKYNFDTLAPQPVKGIRSPVVSPDGRQIVFTALGDLWMLRKGENEPVALTNDPFIEIDPIWSPDGKQLVYTSDKNGNMDIWVRDMSSGKERCVLNLKESLKFPVWSPDGKKIAFYQPAPNGYGRVLLNMIDIHSGEIVTIDENLFDGGRASWSPDSKHVAISAVQSYSSRFREGISKIMLLSLNKEVKQFVTPVPDVSLGTRGVNGPIWSPDGRMMAYTMDGVLWIVPVDEKGQLIGPPERLTKELAEAPSWTADSKSVVYLAVDTLKQVFLADGRTERWRLSLTWQYPKPKDRLVVHAGKVFDGQTDSYLEDVDIIITKNRIKEILPHQADRQGKLVDASTKTVIPGLFEMHTHQNATFGEPLGRLWLSYGITSIREPGTDPYDGIERREAWASGRRIGPRTFISGGHMEGNRIYYNRNVSSPSGGALELELKRAVQLDYDMIKTYVRMPDLMQQRVVAFAHKHGIPVSSHEIYPAVSYGTDGVEHMGATSRRGYSPKLTALNNSYQDVIQLLAKSGTNITPTVSLHGGFSAIALSNPSLFDHPQFKAFFSEELIPELKSRATRTVEGNPHFHSQYKNIQNSVKALLEAGARVTPGTDSPHIPNGLSLQVELQCWVDGGVSPYEALRAATLWSAEAVGVGADLGTIEAGKLADMVIVEGDPLKNIKDALNVQMVIKNGEVHKIEDLLKRP
ncbi:DPP IV N-terminal domain-containing protein [Pontibacter silvestris]|uniref:DPP IV N-terminal domain-containing protein n=1 Tax=Pontibacter silvestris TaxID=2305183 RepID=A0ABW4X0W3_9BACT|nr:DPP IV N-terminal domain-containing protein [Pontibacter silvestris]MCC9138683.1 DPP IV N-terminal domain-containing protein [Pontibacter silvestris]